MKSLRILPHLAVAATASAFAAQADDIVLTPPAGGGVSVTSAAGNVTQFRVADDGSVTMPGTLYKGTDRFLYTFGIYNAFIGLSAGNFTMTGGHNVGFGGNVFAANTTGTLNAAMGSFAFGNNTTGSINAAFGESSLHENTTGSQNTASGRGALFNNTAGDSNTAVGAGALFANTTGLNNVAVGYGAMPQNTTGSHNIALGVSSGNLTTGSFNILIGNGGSPGEGNTMRFGNPNHTRAFVAGIRGVTTGSANAIPVMIDANGQLGTASSSARFKDDIADMASATDALMQLRPVTFHYKEDQDPAGRTLQYGLIAEEVAQIYPGLVAHSADGQVETVMAQFLPPMLLNEFQKQQRTIASQSERIASQSERLASQAARLDALEGELAEFRRMLGRPR
ncbi:hypothetical protein BWI17_12985 [Betaproteobacteria bacterium GR16-43]|nr:hypothetical protein BWI17_12985 [Betaproteobacteria bacterium GR16-43]